MEVFVYNWLISLEQKTNLDNLSTLEILASIEKGEVDYETGLKYIKKNQKDKKLRPFCQQLGMELL